MNHFDDPGQIVPRSRVIIDNDFGGDPDGLFQIAHHLLCPSVEIRGIIASKHHGFFDLPGSPAFAMEKLRQLLARMPGVRIPRLLEGSSETIPVDHHPIDSDAARWIVAEALQMEPENPLVICCGAGLTEVASALLLKPDIARNLRLVWIGGSEYPDLASPPPGASSIEYNTAIDFEAVRVVFNETDVPIWQVPRDAFRQVLISLAELDVRWPGAAGLGGYLKAELAAVQRRAEGRLGETYILGDSPLVLLSALLSPWEPDSSSCRHVQRPCPAVESDGRYGPGQRHRAIRIFTVLDQRLLIEDLCSKVARFDRQASRPLFS